MQTALKSFLAAALSLCVAAPAFAQSYGPFQTSAGPVAVEKVAGPLAYPWSVAFLPAAAPWRGAMLVTERDGALRLIRDGRISAPITGAPEVRAARQGGLLDVALSPDFMNDRRIYLSYSEPVGIFQSRTAVARGVLAPSAQGARLERLEVIFRQDPPAASGLHFGSRLVFADDGKLFVTLGERGDADKAQDLATHYGKVIRINPDGSVPADNPYVGRTDARPEIWSYGHRNPQGAAKRPSDGALFTIAHGARGGDEVNRPQAGRNYGWPEISYGRHYSGFQIGRGTDAPGMEQPLHYWDPSIAPSGAAFYTGDLFPDWKGDLLVGALKFALISRLEISGDTVTESERLFEGAFGRIRDVRQGPDGAIWFLTDDDAGGLYRAAPPGR